MKVIQHSVFLFFISINAFSAGQKEIPTSTHIYNDIAIQVFNSSENNKNFTNKITISKAHLKSVWIQNHDFKIPKIDNPIWNITAKALRVPEEACLDIDATLCSTYFEMNEAEKNQCYSHCLIKNIDFVSYDEKNHVLYLDAESEVSGTAGTPRFLFSAEINKKQITYLNTVMSPYTAYLSTQGSYLAVAGGYGEIEICNTRTGEKFEIRGNDVVLMSNTSRGIDQIHWLNDTELQYEVAAYNDRFQKINQNVKKVIFNAKNKKMML